MGLRLERKFQERFGDRIEVVYADKPLEGEERRLNSKRLSEAVKAVMTAILKREPTPEELLGIKPINGKKKDVS